MNLNIANLLHDSNVNGPGNRDVIWVQGCAIKCPGCFNQHLWSFSPKHIIPVEDLIEKTAKRIDKIEGISILGGEPMHQPKVLGAYFSAVKKMGLTTVIYSGFTYEYLRKQNSPAITKVLEHTDILVDGPYRHDLQDKSLIWRGSTNQRILFLSDIYSVTDIPESTDYFNSEIHVTEKLQTGSYEFHTGIK